MGRGGQVGAVALVVGIVGVMAYFGMRASVFPNVPVSVDATETSSIDQLRGGKKKLVLALLIPGDPLSGQVFLIYQFFLSDKGKALSLNHRQR